MESLWYVEFLGLTTSTGVRDVPRRLLVSTTEDVEEVLRNKCSTQWKQKWKQVRVKPVACPDLPSPSSMKCLTCDIRSSFPHKKGNFGLSSISRHIFCEVIPPQCLEKHGEAAELSRTSGRPGAGAKRSKRQRQGNYFEESTDKNLQTRSESLMQVEWLR